VLRTVAGGAYQTLKSMSAPRLGTYVVRCGVCTQTSPANIAPQRHNLSRASPPSNLPPSARAVHRSTNIGYHRGGALSSK